MKKITPNFGVPLVCQKHNCDSTHKLARHHMGHEKLFLTEFKGTPKQHGKTYKKLKARYEAFRPQDVVVICHEHHAEIHYEYRIIISEYVSVYQLPLAFFTWRQAKALMKEMKHFCKKEWLPHETPGMDPALVFRRSPK